MALNRKVKDEELLYKAAGEKKNPLYQIAINKAKIEQQKKFNELLDYQKEHAEAIAAEQRDIGIREAYAQRKNQELRRTLNMLGYKIPEDMTTVGQAVAGNAAKAQRNILGFNTKEDILAARLGGAQGQGATAAAMAAAGY